MTTRTSASNLKAKLGQYLRAVRAGKTVVVHPIRYRGCFTTSMRAEDRKRR